MKSSERIVLAGRPPTPTALKELHGNPGKRPLNEDEPRPGVYLPDKPPYELTETAQEIFSNKARELFACGILTQLDVEFLAIWAELMDDYITLVKQVRDEGFVYYKQKLLYDGNTRNEPERNPNLITLENLRREIRFYSARLGTEPSARTKLQVVRVQEDELDDFIQRK